jgi:phosphoserine phosphatase RsbU/P
MLATAKSRTLSRSRFRELAFAVLLFLIPALSSKAQTATFNLDTGRQPLASLDGQWRFHPGDDPRWSDPSFDDFLWPTIHSDQPWTEQGYPALSGYAWYRFTIELPAHAQPSSLLLVPIYTSYQIFFDGTLAGTYGKMPPVIAPYAMFQFHAFPLPASPSAAPRTIHVALRVWQTSIWANYIGGGPSRPGNLVGERSLIESELNHRVTSQKVIFEDAYLYTIIGTLIGVTILGLYFFRPKEREYLWFAILLLSCAADQAFQVIYNVFSLIPVPIFDLSDGGLVAINQAAALAFFSIVLRARRGPLWFLSLALAAISPFLLILYWPGWLPVAASAALNWLCLLPSSIWILAVLTNRALKRDVDAWLLTIPTFLYFGFFFLYNLALALSQAGWIVMPDVLLTPLPLPPFTMHWQILVNLIFLAALLAFLIRRFTQARQGEERYATQLEAARQIQQVLVPEAIASVPGFAIDCVYHPAEEVGGDFFQILPIPQGGLLIVMGDVAGKGLPAAMMVSVLVGAIRTEAAHTSDPATILASLNERMFGRSQGGFTTCLCLRITAKGELTASSAGHLSPYRNGQELTLPPAIPLGILSAAHYESATFTLIPGQRLTLVSDGVLEAQSPSGELLGFDRTRELSTKPAAAIAAAAQAFGQNDDITVVTVQYRGESSPSALTSFIGRPSPFKD